MTSKEIQQKIIDLENQIEQFGEMITLTNQLSILKSYKQDLERLEMLEKENKEIEELYLNENKHWCETIDSLRKENEKLKKAIEILKDKMLITVNIPYVWFEDKDNCLYFKVNQQEYELLKEVLGDDK